MPDDILLKDPESGLYNRAYLEERLPAEFKRAMRYVYPLSIVVLEIDSVISIRRTYGVECWQRVLKEFARFLMKFARGNDVVVRSEQGQFVIILPDTHKKGAVIFGDRLLEAIREYIFDAKEKNVQVKVSAGLANFPEDGVRSDEGLLDLGLRAATSAIKSGGEQIFSFKGISKDDIDSIAGRSEKEKVAHFKNKISEIVNQMNNSMIETINEYSKSAVSKDHYDEVQAERVVALSVQMGTKLYLDKRNIDDLKLAAELYHLGKISIPDHILGKKDKLSEDEMDQVRKYPEAGAEMLQLVHFLKGVVPIVLYHRERWDGTGYPEGLKGDQIPLGARILGLADAYQALLSDRPYRKAFSKAEAVAVITKSAGSVFDPDVVEAFLVVLKDKK